MCKRELIHFSNSRQICIEQLAKTCAAPSVSLWNLWSVKFWFIALSVDWTAISQHSLQVHPQSVVSFAHVWKCIVMTRLMKYKPHDKIGFTAGIYFQRSLQKRTRNFMTECQGMILANRRTVLLWQQYLKNDDRSMGLAVYSVAFQLWSVLYNVRTEKRRRQYSSFASEATAVFKWPLSHAVAFLYTSTALLIMLIGYVFRPNLLIRSLGYFEK